MTEDKFKKFLVEFKALLKKHKVNELKSFIYDLNVGEYVYTSFQRKKGEDTTDRTLRAFRWSATGGYDYPAKWDMDYKEVFGSRAPGDVEEQEKNLKGPTRRRYLNFLIDLEVFFRKHKVERLYRYNDEFFYIYFDEKWQGRYWIFRYGPRTNKTNSPAVMKYFYQDEPKII